MDKKKKIEWSETTHKKEWSIKGYEVVAGRLVDAMMIEVRYHTPLYAALLEDLQDDEYEFLQEKERMLEDLDEGDDEPSDEDVWKGVEESRYFWCSDAYSLITSREATPDSILEAVCLSWSEVDIHAIECEVNFCGELVEVASNHVCPYCDYYFCHECREEDEEGECPGCGYKRTGLDAFRQAVKDATKEAV